MPGAESGPCDIHATGGLRPVPATTPGPFPTGGLRPVSAKVRGPFPAAGRAAFSIAAAIGTATAFWYICSWVSFRDRG
jgi:hypothetical protein